MKKFILFLLLLTLLMIIRTNEQGFSEAPSQISSSEVKTDPSIAVTVTAYSPSEEECDEDPFITAFSTRVKEGTIAISRDLEEELGWREGDKIHIKGFGVFVVNDRMALKWKKRVDIFFHDTDRAMSFGIKQAKAVKLEVPQPDKKA